MFVTLAICTWNRASLLDSTLAEIQNLNIPDGIDWELLIVNNNCTDHTDAIIAKHASTMPIRRAFEAKPGIANARNRVIDEAKGDWIIWTDDDVLVKPNWLQEYIKTIQQFPDAAYLGGPVHPWFSVQPPKWLVEHFAEICNWWSILDYGPLIRLLQPNEQIFGANMAIQTKHLKEVRFDPDKGHKAGLLSGCEETLLIESLAKKGHKGVWVGTAPVNHYIPAYRLTKQFFWKRLHDQACLCTSVNEYQNPKHIALAPRWLWRKYFKLRLKLLFWRLFHNQKWLNTFISAANIRGNMSALLKR